MDLRGKFKTFIEDSRQKLLSPGHEVAPAELPRLLLPPGTMRPTALTDSDLEVSQLVSDPQADQETLDLIPAEYYSENFDPSLHQLESLTAVTDQAGIDRDRKLLLQQLTVVSKRVFRLILERQNSCSIELEQIVAVQMELLEAMRVCREGRSSLGRARRQFVNSSLGILAGCRRRQQALLLLDNLTIIQTLQKTEEKLQELLLEERYPEAIRVLLECQTVAANYRHFHSIRQLSSKLQDTLVMAEEQLDVTLARVSTNFTTASYAKLQEAYELLGKTQTAMDQLLMHVTSAIHNTSWNLVHGHAALAGNCASLQELSKRPFPELCQSLSVELFLPCLLDLCKSLWDIMLNYRKIMAWHAANTSSSNSTDLSSSPPASPTEATEVDKLERLLQRQYVEKKLESGLGRIWQDVQTKVRVLVLSSNLAELSIDLFIQFLDIIHRLIQVGKEFSGSSSDTLQESLQKQCFAYFTAYHQSRLDELKTHLENESWALCPVKPSFSPRSLAEFAHLKSLGSSSSIKSPSKRTMLPSSFFSDFWETKAGTPFDDALLEASYEEDILMESNNSSGRMDSDEEEEEEDLSEEQKMEILNENDGEPHSSLATLKTKAWSPPPAKSGLCLANTTLMLLRLFGRYTHLARLLHPIAGDILRGMVQVLDYYIYAVHAFFVDESGQGEVSPLLRQFIQEIQGTVIRREAASAPVEATAGSQQLRQLAGLINAPVISPTVVLSRRETVFGLAERIVGVESCVYLAGQLLELRPCLLEEQQQQQLPIPDVRELVVELRSPAFYSSVLKALQLDAALGLMAKVSWDVKEVQSQHSDYVDYLLRQLQTFGQSLARIAGLVPVSPDLQRLLWTLAAKVAAHIFVEGFAMAKKCTNEGRALMQLDYRQFVLKLEAISGLRPLPYQTYVSAYVKAFYIPDSELELWVQSHPEYSDAQLVALVNSVAYSNNKTRQKLNALISDLSVRIRR